MKVGTLVGLILIVVGAVGLFWGGITYTEQRDVARLGPVQVTATERRSIPVPPIVGGIVLIAGIALIVAVKRAR